MADSENVIAKRELTREAIATLEQWLTDYTSPWADKKQRKIIAHAVDYENGYLVLEVAKVTPVGVERSPKRYTLTVAVTDTRKG